MSDSTPDDAGWLLDEYDADRFWSSVNFRGGTEHENDPLATATGECWVWATRAEGEYAKFRMHEHWHAAHRIAYRDFGNKIPDDHDIDHLCRNPRCVNPAHLEPVTRSVNCARGLNGNHTGRCPSGHEYTEENTRYVLSHGKRRPICATCDKARKRLAYQRRKSAA